MFFLSEKHQSLASTVSKTVQYFPKTFDKRLQIALHGLIANTSSEFIQCRSIHHLKRVLLTQFFLQKRIESLLLQNKDNRAGVIRIFPNSSHISVAIALSFCPQAELMNEELLFKTMQAYIPGIRKVPRSSYSWTSRDHSYLFYYLELQKLRGKTFSRQDLKKIEEGVKKSIFLRMENTSLFSPYNYEEIHRQIFSLNKEISSQHDLPQIAIHFKGEFSYMLEFVVHVVCPENSVSLDTLAKRLSSLARYEVHLRTKFQHPISSDAFVFSVFLPCSDPLQSNNLIKTRKAVIALLEETIGLFHDCNGGMFAKQEQLFENLRQQLAPNIQDFSLFAEHVFYSLKPVELQTSLTSSQAKVLFQTFSTLMRRETPATIDFLHDPVGVFIVKAKERMMLKKYLENTEISPSASFTLFGVHYLIFLDFSTLSTQKLVWLFFYPKHTKKQLRLAFQEGFPPSLNPSFMLLDPHCRTIHRALFEGLTRVDLQAKPALAGAQSIQLSLDKLTYTITLRPNRWSNGEKVTASHYAQAWKQTLLSEDQTNSKPLCILKNGEKILKRALDPNMLGVHIHDSQTLEIQLEHPDPYFLYRLACPPFLPIYDQRKEPTIFNGPFWLTSQTETVLQLERNPYFWNCNKVYYDHVEIRSIPQLSDILELHQMNQVDWIGSPFADIPQDYYDFSLNKVYEKEIIRPFWVHFNSRDSLLRSPQVRQALKLAIDYEKLEQLQPISPGYKPAFQHQFDPELARQLLPKNLRTPLTLHCSSFSGERKLATFLKKNWEQHLDLKVIIKELEWNAFFHSLEQGEFQIAGTFVTPLIKDSLELFERFEQNSHLNFSKFSHPEYSRYIADAKRTPHPEQRTALLSKATEILEQETPFVSLLNQQYCFSHDSTLKGYVIDVSGGVDFSYAYKED